MLEITSNLPILVLIIIFIASLVSLIKGADYLLKGAERIGRYLKLPEFVIGALIIGIGTSLPELATSIFAVIDDITDIVAANVIGSNIANILLVAGLSSVVGGVIHTTKNLIKLEIPLLVISTALFLFVAYDGTIDFYESLVMFSGFIIYVVYLINADRFRSHIDDAEDEEEKKAFELLNTKYLSEKIEKITKISWKEWAMFLGGVVLLSLGANYLVDSVVAFSEKFNVATSIVSVLAIAIGTSLPEILVSIKAVFKGKTNIAFGNIFGSNVFNILMLTGILGIFKDLEVSQEMVSIGLPFLAITTLIFYVSAMSRRIYIWEGLMFLIFYGLFVLKVIGF